MDDRVIVTGAAGFIGYHVASGLLKKGYRVLGMDNLNAYYSVQMKRDKLDILYKQKGFEFQEIDISNEQGVGTAFNNFLPGKVIHLAAQAGVRFSVENPQVYVQSNLVGMGNILEACRRSGVGHLVYASSSSVYGNSRRVPYSSEQQVDYPVSFYAATKKANELMAHSYSELYGLATTGIRFFTVYGPWNRPDMALSLFTEAILSGNPIRLFNGGQMKRDFTFVEDATEGILALLEGSAAFTGSGRPLEGQSEKYRIYNLGNNLPVELGAFISVLETCLGRKAVRISAPMQPGDVKETWANIDDLVADVGYRPRTQIEDGIPRFVSWYKAYHNL